MEKRGQSDLALKVVLVLVLIIIILYILRAFEII